MRRIRRLSLFVVPLLVWLPAALGAQETIDFESLAEGQIVDQVFSRQGSGPVVVEGSNEKFPPGRNAAIIFDSSCPEDGTPRDCSGEDPDLGTPHLDFDGPGRGDAGRRSGLFPNAAPLGKVLIIGEDLVDADGDGLVDDPDDEGWLRLNLLSFDFSAVGPVKLHGISILDINFDDQPSSIDLLDAEGNLLGDSPYVLPQTENNGVIVDFGLGDTEDVVEMIVWLRGSGAIDNIVFSRQGPRVELETLTNGVQADLADGDDVPWIRAGQPVTWTYVVTNVGTVPLTGIAVVDDRQVPVSCPRDQLAPGESMECSASGVSLDLGRSDLDFPTVTGICQSRRGRPLYQNTGSVTANGPAGLAVADTDPSHYCGDPGEPEIYVRKQTKGPDSRGLASGSDATFEIAVSNRGTEDLRDIKVADVKAPDCNREFGRLAAGKSVSYTCTAPGLGIGGEGVDGCSFVNEVVATGSGSSATVTDRDTATIELLALSIDKRPVEFPGENATFEIVIVNGGCDLDGVRVDTPQASGCERDLGLMKAGAEPISYRCSMAVADEVCVEGTRGDARVRACGSEAAAPGTAGTAPESDPYSEGGGPDSGEPGSAAEPATGSGEGSRGVSRGLLAVLLAVLVGGGLFAWNRMRAG